MKANEHTINLPLLYCGNLSAAKEQCFLQDEGAKHIYPHLTRSWAIHHDDLANNTPSTL